MLTASPFLELVVGEYFLARRLSTEHPKVTRGESRSVSAVVEDIFAVEVAKAYATIDHIYVNQTITSTMGRLDGRMKPDLILCKSGTVRLLIDLKMDVGYKRKDFTNVAVLCAQAVRHLRGKTVSLWKKENDSRQRMEYQVADDLLYAYVIISDSNVSSQTYRKIVASVSQLSELRLFTLVRGTHPNMYEMDESKAKAKTLLHASKSDFAALSNLIADAAT